MVFTLQYRQWDLFSIGFWAPIVLLWGVGYLFYIIFSAIEIQCNYFYDGNKDTLMIVHNVDVNWVQKKATNNWFFN